MAFKGYFTCLVLTDLDNESSLSFCLANNDEFSSINDAGKFLTSFNCSHTGFKLPI